MAAYLTCTAAQAPQNHGFVSLNQLLESRASSHPHLDVAAFPELTDGTWKVTGFTYSSLFLASNAAAHCYIRTSSLSARTDSSQRIVALLAPSGADLLVTLFAALRLGYAVLLLAPQNTPEAIAHLCRTTSATHLICHPSLRSRPIADIQIIELVPRDIWKNSDPIVPLFLTPDEEMDMPALVMHTSGSTGMPKPVYHPHRIWTQAIPCIPGEPAFTTTPLFHGGSADLLRAMNALSTLYLFSSTHPITVSNILGAMSATTSRITAFLSVPYILKMLAEDPRGLQMLQRMELVSTGGAPLPEALGDEMVRRGVRLVSRLGSSECGFLMSSHREYETDREWSWLRDDSAPSPTPLRFEPAGEDDEFELVVPREWTTRVVANREDGSFATGDLYVPHRSIPHAWQYRGRTDDIVVLTNGKKVSAQPLESALRASPHIAEAIVFGASRASLGVLVLPSTTSPTAGPGMILSCVAQLNQTTPPYAHILPALVVVLPLSHGASLPRTSKGSLVRPRALVQYAEAIDGAYRRFEEGGGGEEAGDVRGYVRRVVMEAVRQKQAVVVGDDEDLFELGVDSLQAMAIRNALQKTVGAGRVLGSTVVYDFPSVNKLVQHLADMTMGREDGVPGSFADEQQQYQLMRALLERYGTFTGVDSEDHRPVLAADSPVPPINTRSHDADGSLIVLTGTTGALGAHILFQLLTTTDLHVVAPVRASGGGAEHAMQRVRESLLVRKLRLPPAVARDFANRVSALPCAFAQADLGIGSDAYRRLLMHAVAVIHVAWPVNFAYRLESFAPVLCGTRNLINLAVHSHRKARFVFCSSIAAASVSPSSSSPPNNIVYEVLPRAEADAAPLGYARSKWVAEHMCQKAYERGDGRVAIARVGQLCGDTGRGVWNESEGWPLMIASVRYCGCLPELDEHPSWLPIDIAAKTLVDIALRDPPDRRETGGASVSVPVYHVVSPTRTTSWSDVLGCLEQRCGLVFDRVPPATWVEKLKACELALDSGTRSMLGMWENKYWRKEQSSRPEPTFDVSLATGVSAVMKRVPPISEEAIEKFVGCWRETGFLPT